MTLFDHVTLFTDGGEASRRRLGEPNRGRRASLKHGRQRNTFFSPLNNDKYNDTQKRLIFTELFLLGDTFIKLPNGSLFVNLL